VAETCRSIGGHSSIVCQVKPKLLHFNTRLDRQRGASFQPVVAQDLVRQEKTVIVFARVLAVADA